MEILSGLAIGGIIFIGGSQVILDQTTPGTFFIFDSTFDGISTNKIIGKS